MNIRMLQMLVEVVRQGGFSRAAQVVFATQSTVSKAVQAVEERLNVRIFERQPQGVRLTVEGRMVYEHACRILDAYAAMAKDVDALHSLEKGELRIGFPPIGSGVLFAEFFTRFRQMYPGVVIQTQEQGCAALENMLLSGELELALTLLPVPAEFAWLPLRDEPLVVLMPRDYPLDGRSSLKLEELADRPFIWFEQGFLLNDRIQKLCRERGLTLRECLRSGQVDFILTLVASGMGVAALPRLALAQRDLSQIQTALLDEDELRWRAVLAWRRDAALSSAAQACIHLLQAGVETAQLD